MSYKWAETIRRSKGILPNLILTVSIEDVITKSYKKVVERSYTFPGPVYVFENLVNETVFDVTLIDADAISLEEAEELILIEDSLWKHRETLRGDKCTLSSMDYSDILDINEEIYTFDLIIDDELVGQRIVFEFETVSNS
jgi:hypothetical protein